MGAYVTVYGVPERQAKVSSRDRLQEAMDKADETLCRLNLSKDWDSLNRQGRADRVRCLARD